MSAALQAVGELRARPSGMLRLSVPSIGLTFGMEETFIPYIARGELVPILEEFCPPFPGFYLYYPKRKDVPLKLRALVDHLRQGNRERRSGAGRARHGSPRSHQGR